MVERLFLALPWGCLRFVVVVFPDHTHYFGMVSKNILLAGLNLLHGVPTSPFVQMRIKTYKCLVCIKDPKLIHALSLRTYQNVLFWSKGLIMLLTNVNSCVLCYVCIHICLFLSR